MYERRRVTAARPDLAPFTLCAACGASLAPGAGACPNCGTTDLPMWSNRLWLMPAALSATGAVLAVVCLAAGGNGLKLLGWSGLGLLALSLPCLWALRGGGAGAWHGWTVVLAMVIGASAVCQWLFLATSERPESPLAWAYLAITVGYVGLAWRCRSEQVWAKASAAYLALAGVAAVWMSLVPVDIGRDGVPLLWACRTAMWVGPALLALTYAVPVRWWHQVGLGWTGEPPGRA